MKQIIACILLFLCLNSAWAQTADDFNNDKALNGPWWSQTNNRTPSYMATHYPFLKATFIAFHWKDLEPSPNVFSYNAMDSMLALIANAGLKTCMIIYTGNSAPHWLYQTMGIDSFANDEGQTFPEYRDTLYQSRWKNMMTHVFTHLSTLSTTIRNSLAVINSAEGTTGDENPFRGSAVPGPSFPYGKSNATWIAWRKTSWTFTNSLLTTWFPSTNPSGSSITLLVNPSNDSTLIANYCGFLFASSSALKHTWLKAGAVGHGYQLNEEAVQKRQYDPYVNNILATIPGATQSRCRAEMDESYPWFEEAPKWSFYWMAWNALHFGLDDWCNLYGNYSNTNFDSAWTYYADYAGLKDPKFSSKGFCILRDGLDASDTVRFKNSVYGTGTIDDYSHNTSSSRAWKIDSAFASFGARQEDYEAANGNSLNQRKSDGMNDVGWQIFPGNYERFITQVNLPGGVFKGGFWRLGPFVSGVPTDPYGRFAKGFDPSHSITDLYFDVNDRLSTDSNANGSRKVRLSIVYLNAGNSSQWKLTYKTRNASNVISTKTLTITNSGTDSIWQQVNIDIDSLCIDNQIAVSGKASCDIMLTNLTTGKKQAFHKIEVRNQPSGSPRVANPQPEVLVLTPSLPASLTSNPGDGRFRVNWKDNGGVYTILIHNVQGAIVYQQEHIKGSSLAVDISRFATGTYYVRVICDGAKADLPYQKLR